MGSPEDYFSGLFVYLYIDLNVMKLLDNLNSDSIRSLGIRKLRDSIESKGVYSLLKEGRGRLLLVSSSEYSKVCDSLEDYVVFDGCFLKAPEGVFKIVSEDSNCWVVEGDDTLETILKPTVLLGSDRKSKERCRYSLSMYVDIGNRMLLNPPYSSMDVGLWIKAISQLSQSGCKRTTPGKILQLYKKLKSL